MISPDNHRERGHAKLEACYATNLILVSAISQIGNSATGSYKQLVKLLDVL